jgi:UDP-3-O-[3-hydroxymyristoyl] glucosamine N-acyltransferase
MNIRPIISGQIRLRSPDLLQIGEGSIVDDFCYFSARVEIGRFCHIANGVTIAGGRGRVCQIGDYSSISAGSKIWCRSDNFISDLAALVPKELSYQKNEICGDVSLGPMTIVGSNTVVMPDNCIPEGVAIGALSFVPTAYQFKPWTVYAGIPIQPIRERNRESVEGQRRSIEQHYRERFADESTDG